MWPIDILSSKLAEMDAEARKVRLKFLAAVHTNAKEKAKVRKQRSKILSISFSRNDLLRIYADAGLSREPRLTGISVKHGTEQAAALEQDLEGFRLSLSTLLRLDLVVKEDYPLPINVGSRNLPFEPKLPSTLDVDVKSEYSFRHLGSAFMSACEPVKTLTTHLSRMSHNGHLRA